MKSIEWHGSQLVLEIGITDEIGMQLMQGAYQTIHFLVDALHDPLLSFCVKPPTFHTGWNFDGGEKSLRRALAVSTGTRKAVPQGALCCGTSISPMRTNGSAWVLPPRRLRSTSSAATGHESRTETGSEILHDLASNAVAHITGIIVRETWNPQIIKAPYIASDLNGVRVRANAHTPVVAD